MQLITDYQHEAFLRVLLQGAPGSGKTDTAMNFPKCYFADCDINMEGALRRRRKAGLSLPVGFDVIDRIPTPTPEDPHAFKVVEPKLRYERLALCLQQACSNPEIETIVIDAATKVCEYIQAHVLRVNPTKTGGMEMTSWGFFFTYWKDLVSKVTAQRKNLVLICHEKLEKDELDGSIRYNLLIPGQFASMAGSLFTDVWRCEVASSGVGSAQTHKFNIRTMPDHKFSLKNSLGLPAVMEFNWQKIAEAMK